MYQLIGSQRYWFFIPVLAVLIAFPQIDLTVSKWFFTDNHFFLRHNRICEWIRITTPLLILGTILLLILFGVVSAIVRQNPFQHGILRLRTLCYLLATLAIGPGLLANSLFKEHWGRARPSAIDIFGGSKDFSPALVMSDQCVSNCSFVSGHAALAFWTVSVAFLTPPPWRRFFVIVTALYSCLVGFARIAQGSHFLSDVVFSAVLVVYVNQWLKPLLHSRKFSLDYLEVGINMINELNGLYFEDLSIGMQGIFARTVTEADIILFAGVSGDNSPVHLNEEYAKKTRFKTRIAHGSLCGAYISACMAMHMPGPGCIYISQTLKFLSPVHIGDTVIVRVEVRALDERKKFATLATRCFIETRIVVDGEAVLMVPTRS